MSGCELETLAGRVTCLLVLVSEVRDLSLLNITPRPWNSPGLPRSVSSLMLLTQEIDLTILRSTGLGFASSVGCLAPRGSRRLEQAVLAQSDGQDESFFEDKGLTRPCPASPGSTDAGGDESVDEYTGAWSR